MTFTPTQTRAAAMLMAGQVQVAPLIEGQPIETLLADVGDIVTENSGEGQDLVTSSISYTLGAHVENLTLAESAFALTGTGNALDNVITGNSNGVVVAGSSLSSQRTTRPRTRPAFRAPAWPARPSPDG